VLVKPITPPRLLAAVRGLIPAVTSPPAGDWDDDAALKALNGQSAHVQALRELFLPNCPASANGSCSARRPAMSTRCAPNCTGCKPVAASSAPSAWATPSPPCAASRFPAALTNLLAAIDAMLKPDIAGPR
jgi:hypothetical protein